MKKLSFLAGAILAFACQHAFADQLVYGVPTAWRLQSYGTNSVALYYTGSSCGTTALTLPSTATERDNTRLYATVMAAKIAGTRVFAYYDPATCFISSFGLMEN
jgi:hypothetical protein